MPRRKRLRRRSTALARKVCRAPARRLRVADGRRWECRAAAGGRDGAQSPGAELVQQLKVRNSPRHPVVTGSALSRNQLTVTDARGALDLRQRIVGHDLNGLGQCGQRHCMAEYFGTHRLSTASATECAAPAAVSRRFRALWQGDLRPPSTQFTRCPPHQFVRSLEKSSGLSALPWGAATLGALLSRIRACWRRVESVSMKRDSPREDPLPPSGRADRSRFFPGTSRGLLLYK